jgi:hypothetical protein
MRASERSYDVKQQILQQIESKLRSITSGCMGAV